VSLAGELEMATAYALRTKLRELALQGGVMVTIDLSRVTFVDSTGLRVLVECHRHLSALRGQLRVVVTQPNIRRMLRLTGLDRSLYVYESFAGSFLP
jgi:anti-sigma B factor antagonist